MASVERHGFTKQRVRALSVHAIAVGTMLCVALASSPTAVAEQGNGILRMGVLAAKEEMRATLHAFVKALNSSLISGETDPLGPIAEALHPGIVLTATPPPTAFDPSPTPLVFGGLHQVIVGYGQGVVASTKPNIVASSIDVRILDRDTAEADLRFANSISVPAGCLLGAAGGCAQVLLFADVFVSFERGAGGAWQVTNIDLVHYIAR